MIDQIATAIYDEIFQHTFADYNTEERPGFPLRKLTISPYVTISFQREYSMRGGPWVCNYDICFFSNFARFQSKDYYYWEREFPDNLLEAIHALINRSQKPRWAPR